MKSDGLTKHFVLAFALAGIGYAIFYFGIEHRRNQKGPWAVVFTNTPAGTPMIIVDQPTIGVTNVQISFAGEKVLTTNGMVSNVFSPTHLLTGDVFPLPPNSPATSMVQHFSRPYEVPFTVPFGKCLFMDTTFLPGTITFEFFGHEVELLPRALIIDYHEHPWQSGAAITVSPAQTPTSGPGKR